MGHIANFMSRFSALMTNSDRCLSRLSGYPKPSVLSCFLIFLQLERFSECGSFQNVEDQ